MLKLGAVMCWLELTEAAGAESPTLELLFNAANGRADRAEERVG
jgi:hypothetical protein